MLIRIYQLAFFVTVVLRLCAPTIDAGEVSKVAIPGGKHVTVHHSHALFNRNADIQHAVIVIHGVLRNSANYFDNMSDAVALSGLQTQTLIVAPGIKIEEDAESDEYYWTARGWSQGDLAWNGRDKVKVSSFDAFDELLKIVSNRTHFPSLKTVAVIGHSAGGQFVNRYVSAANLPNDREIDIRFIVLNPSSYMYPDERRLLDGKVAGKEELSERFPDYNHYRDGTEELNTAMRRVGVDRIREQLFTRKCYYFAGSKDVNSHRLATGPSAMAQGKNRFDRFGNYRDFVAAYDDPRWRKNTRFMAVEGVGHNSGDMFDSEQVREALFCNTNASPRPGTFGALKETREFSKTIDTAAVVVIQHGKVVDQWGAVAMPINCHSVRKSILSALYGSYVEDGTIDLDVTLAQLGIDDNEPSLTEVERGATIRDLLKARSGIFHPALYESASMKAKRPPRGSHPPGTFWYYNNWDFNALCTIFEKLSQQSVFDAFESRLAKPLGMQDFQRDRDTLYVTGDDSEHPAYPFFLSARDLAKFGQLMLQRGRWNGEQLVPESWVRESTTYLFTVPRWAVGGLAGSSRSVDGG